MHNHTCIAHTHITHWRIVTVTCEGELRMNISKFVINDHRVHSQFRHAFMFSFPSTYTVPVHPVCVRFFMTNSTLAYYI